MPETYIRKQTLTSGERYITQELKELESKILGAHERLISLERRLFDELLESIGAQLDRIQRTANAIAQLDVLAALADIRVPIYAVNARQVENNCAVVSLTIGINNTEHLNRVVARLSKVRDVLKVTRS